MRNIICLSLFALFTLPAFAQQSVAEAAAQARNAGQALPPDAPTRDQVLTFLDLMQARRNMMVAMDNMKQIMKQAAEKTFRERIPNPSPKQIEALDGMVDDIDVPLDEMVNAIIPIYQRHLTKADIDELIRFYSSPVGQKLLREQPQILQEGMQAGAAIQQKRMDEFMVKVRGRMQALIEASEENNNTRKK